MKSLYTALLSTLLLGAIHLSAQGSVATTPVGCYPVTLKAGADTAVGVPLERAAAFVGRIEAREGNTLTLAGAAGWTPGQFAGSPEDLSQEYFYLQVVTGELRGATFLITDSSENAVTVLPESEELSKLLTLAASGAGETVRIVPYWTPASLFAHSDLPEGACIVLPSETDGVAAEELVYTASGWTLGGNPADLYPLRRGFGLFVCLPEGVADVELDILGHVPFVPERFIFEGAELERGKDVFFALSHPEAIRLVEAGLEFDDRTVVFAYGNEARFGDNPTSVYTYYEGHGWFDQVFRPVDPTVMLEPGSAYFVRVPPTPAHTQFVWERIPMYLSSL